MSKQKLRPVEEMRQEVVRLRGEGLSFSQVSRELGISKSYAIKLSKSQSDRSLQSVTGQRGLSVRQRKFAAGLAEGKTQRQAALDAGAPPASADQWASAEVRNPKFLSEFDRMLDRAGLSDEAIAKIHAENLRATKTVVVTHRGQITDTLEVPDHPTRQRAVRDGWDVLGRLMRPEGAGAPSINVTLTVQEKIDIEGLIGRPLDVKVTPPRRRSRPSRNS